MRIRTWTAAVAIPLAMWFTACGGDDDGAADDRGTTAEAPAAEQRHNDADVEFAEMMIPHHRQAAEMAALATDRAESTEIRDMAQGIISTQEGEIEQMTAWLEEWGEDVPPEADAGSGSIADEPTSAGDEMSTTTMAAHGAAEMMSSDDMSALEAASGADFDRMFAEMMTEHHRSAVEMANDEIENGEFPDAVELAESIVATQEAEIAQFEAFLEAAP